MRRFLKARRWTLLLNLGLFLLYLITTRRLEEDQWNGMESKRSFGEDVFEDMDYALETFEYMRDLRSGSAFIRPVTEYKEKHIERWSCWARRPPKTPSHLLQIPGTEWQTDSTDATALYLYSAYFDARQNSLFPDTVSVQILAMVERKVGRNVFCQLYSDGTDERAVDIVRAHVRPIWQRAWDPRDRFYLPLLITCPIARKHYSQMKHNRDYMKYVAVVREEPCSASSNLLAISGNMSRLAENGGNRVAVCVKGMDFAEDVSWQLVEWLEAQYLFGADRTVFYTYYVHPKMAVVFRHYERRGLLTEVGLSLAGNSPNLPHVRSKYIWRNRQQKRRHELVPYNDCLYRHINTHRYILILDIDELIVPLQHRLWSEMLDNVTARIEARDLTAISAINVFKFPSLTRSFDRKIPVYMHKVRHRRRSRTSSKQGEYGKSFMLTQNLATVFNHYGLHRLRGHLANTVYIEKDTAVKLHYKDSCPVESKAECPSLLQDTIDDPSLDRFAPNLTLAVTTVLNRFNFL